MPKIASMPVEPYVSLSEAAQYFSVSERTLRRHIASRQIPAKRLGGAIRLKLSQVEEAMTPMGKSA